MSANKYEKLVENLSYLNFTTKEQTNVMYTNMYFHLRLFKMLFDKGGGGVKVTLSFTYSPLISLYKYFQFTFMIKSFSMKLIKIWVFLQIRSRGQHNAEEL